MARLAKIIRFPVERRQQQIQGNTEISVPPGMQVTITNSTAAGEVTAVTGTVSWHPPTWWASVPVIPPLDETPANERVLWMKLGVNPKLRAKRHRVISIQREEQAGELVLVAVAACRRRAVLSRLFNDAWSGGDCEGCKKRGLR